MEEYGNWLRPQLRPGCWVAYEAPIVHPDNTMHGIMITAGLAVETERLCREVSKDINYTSYSVATIKKTFAGHGFAPKSSMMEIARRLGADVSANHEADALGVWYCLLGLYDRMRKTSHLTEQLSPLFMNRTTP